MSKCIRCGKDRIIKESHTEKSDTATVLYTTTVCPDPECQKQVDKTLKVDENKRKSIRIEQENRAKELKLKKQQNSEE